LGALPGSKREAIVESRASLYPLRSGSFYNRHPSGISLLRILLLSDIHANLEALEACLAGAPAHDLVANLGDVVGYGASPNEVIDRSRELGKIFVRGNHDKAATGLLDLDDFNPMAAAAAVWTRDQLTPEHHEWLRGLPQGPLPLEAAPEVQLVHGSPADEDAYVVSVGDALVPLITIATPITFFGHTHLQGGFFANGSSADGFRPEYRTVGKAESVSLQLKPDTRYMINPGSVGQPRDGDWRAAFGLFDTEARVVHFHRTPYNLKAAQDRIFAAELPARLATRLAAGR
jgi:diadenosine tetraphosphatase ApaH/serine/threonine PP2A family protein phosphatase